MDTSTSLDYINQLPCKNPIFLTILQKALLMLMLMLKPLFIWPNAADAVVSRESGSHQALSSDAAVSNEFSTLAGPAWFFFLVVFLFFYSNSCLILLFLRLAALLFISPSAFSRRRRRCGC